MGKLFASCVLLLWILNVGDIVKGNDPNSCNFQAIYNFGDSNSDTGGISAVYNPIPSPNGQTFFGKPAGRVSDGRLVIDFIAENLGLPYLHPYLDSLATNFRHGANFATGGSSIRPPTETIFESGHSPFPLAVQLWQFDQFKARSTDLYKQGAKNPSENAYLPNPDEFSNAIYTFDIGQNDLSHVIGKVPDDQAQAIIPDMIQQYSAAIQKMYQQGARTFWIHNLGPLGCLPVTRLSVSGGSQALDQYGCVKSHNDIVSQFNQQLKNLMYQLRGQLKDAALVYVDIYSAKYQLISDAKNQGFDADPFKICCGVHDQNNHVMCGKTQNINGKDVYGSACENPSMYISWDGVHFSEKANQWVANRVISGKLSDPPISLSQACHGHA
ncbi:GDSL esterase/lipase [Thalictrum thalictroides]|uniref:GDSL esterase/lipase n=1 Tax=Thalictrum thalictroides TaxID=46969 RepID=A0A7J6VJ85_THATH|nr:GDSL esterase/lipase [Thalictrum thalictroides]